MPEKQRGWGCHALAIPMNIAAHHRMTFEPGPLPLVGDAHGHRTGYNTSSSLLAESIAPRISEISRLFLVIVALRTRNAAVGDPAAGSYSPHPSLPTPVVQFVTGSLFVENFWSPGVRSVDRLWRFGETGHRKFLYLRWLWRHRNGYQNMAPFCSWFWRCHSSSRDCTARKIPRPSVGGMRVAVILLLVTSLPTYAIGL